MVPMTTAIKKPFQKSHYILRYSDCIRYRSMVEAEQIQTIDKDRIIRRIRTKAYQPLQLKLYNIIKGSQAVDVSAVEGGANTVATSISESIEPASIIFATLPILVVYPFVQRYFVSGVTIGAIKG